MDCSDEEIAYLIEGEALVIRCALNMQIKEDDVDQRRGNTRFQTNSASSSSTWRPNLKREGVVQPKPYAKAKPPNTKKDAHTD